LKKCAVTIEAMAAANFSRDVLENFYGGITRGCLSLSGQIEVLILK